MKNHGRLATCAAVLLALAAVPAAGAGAFGNVSGTDYCVDETSSTFPAECTKPTADVNGTVIDIVQAIHSQTAGAFTFALNGSNQTINVISGPTNAPTLFKSGSQWRLGLTADATPFQGNNASAASAQKTMLAMIYTGIDTTNPIRDTATNTGTGTTGTCPDTTAAAQVGDIVSRRFWWNDDGDNIFSARPGAPHNNGPLHQPAASSGKAIAVSYYVAASAANPGTANFTITISRPWVCETVIFRTAGAAAAPLPLILQQH